MTFNPGLSVQVSWLRCYSLQFLFRQVCIRSGFAPDPGVTSIHFVKWELYEFSQAHKAQAPACNQ